MPIPVILFPSRWLWFWRRNWLWDCNCHHSRSSPPLPIHSRRNLQLLKIAACRSFQPFLASSLFSRSSQSMRRNCLWGCIESSIESGSPSIQLPTSIHFHNHDTFMSQVSTCFPYQHNNNVYWSLMRFPVTLSNIRAKLCAVKARQFALRSFNFLFSLNQTAKRQCHLSSNCCK